MKSICSFEIAITISQLNKILTNKIKQEAMHEEIADLHPTQIKALFLLQEKEELKLSDLASDLSLTKPTVTVLAQKLKDKGCIKRKSCPEDKRCSRLRLTDQGKEVISSFMSIENRIEKELFAKLDEAEITTCLNTLKTIINNANKKG